MMIPYERNNSRGYTTGYVETDQITNVSPMAYGCNIYLADGKTLESTERASTIADRINESRRQS